MKQLLLVSTILFLNTMAFAKTLECNDGPSYTGRSFSINRDGAIGFNGTYIVMKADSAWDLGNRGQISLDQITGRAADAKYSVKDITLAISPKSAYRQRSRAACADCKNQYCGTRRGC